MFFHLFVAIISFSSYFIYDSLTFNYQLAFLTVGTIAIFNFTRSMSQLGHRELFIAEQDALKMKDTYHLLPAKIGTVSDKKEAFNKVLNNYEEVYLKLENGDNLFLLSPGLLSDKLRVGEKVKIYHHKLFVVKVEPLSEQIENDQN